MQQFHESENFGFSPFGLFTCLGLIASGSKGQTTKEIAKTLSVPGDDAVKSLNENVSKLVDYYVLMLSLSKQYEIYYINKLLKHKGSQPPKEFEKAARKIYGSVIELFDFSAKTAVDDINTYIKSQTKNKIDSIVKKFDDKMKLAVINILCVRVKILHKFKKCQGKKYPFYNNWDKGQRKEIEMMRGIVETNYGEIQISDVQTQVLQLACSADLSLFFLLPKSPSSFTAMSKMTASDFKHINKSTVKRKVHLRLPKLDSSVFCAELNEPLKALGIHAAFDSKTADMSGIDPNGHLHLSDVIHGIKMEYYEQEAIDKSEEKKDAVDFHIEHPFMFMLGDLGNDIILIIGKVLTFK